MCRALFFLALKDAEDILARDAGAVCKAGRVSCGAGVEGLRQRNVELDGVWRLFESDIGCPFVLLETSGGIECRTPDVILLFVDGFKIQQGLDHAGGVFQSVGKLLVFRGQGGYLPAVKPDRERIAESAGWGAEGEGG